MRLEEYFGLNVLILRMIIPFRFGEIPAYVAFLPQGKGREDAKHGTSGAGGWGLCGSAANFIKVRTFSREIESRLSDSTYNGGNWWSAFSNPATHDDRGPVICKCTHHVKLIKSRDNAALLRPSTYNPGPVNCGTRALPASIRHSFVSEAMTCVRSRGSRMTSAWSTKVLPRSSNLRLEHLNQETVSWKSLIIY